MIDRKIDAFFNDFFKNVKKADLADIEEAVQGCLHSEKYDGWI